MSDVTFGSFCTSDWELILSAKEIGSPNPKLETVDIPGSDGVLDMSDYFGGVKYENRTLKFDFSTNERGQHLLQLYSEIQEELTGQYFEKISISDDPDYYYSGRVTAVSLAENSVSTITVTCSCEPYKTAFLSRTVTIRLAALPLDDSYGDCNGDGVIDTLDATYLIKAVEGESTSELSLSSCDLNLDGTIDNDDITLLNDFLASSYTDIKDYAETLDLYRDTSMTVDFGRCAAVVSFILSYSYIGGNPQPWTMFVDGEQYMQGDCENGSFSGSFIISGKHTLTFRTSRMGKVLLKFPKKRL